MKVSTERNILVVLAILGAGFVISVIGTIAGAIFGN